jgi:dipeptidyl aminopeptidase/acylaminoacyl peptidase
MAEHYEGARAQPRKDLKPPPHWRLEAVAHTPRPRSLVLAADRRHAFFIEDRDTSDVYRLDLEGGAPERLTTGRELAAWWEDPAARPSPDGRTVAYAAGGHIWLAATTGGPPRKLAEGGDPRWIDDERVIISVERDDATQLAVVDIDRPWPQRLSQIDDLGDEEEPAVSPDGTRVAFTFFPRDDLNRSEIRVADLGMGVTSAPTGTPGMHDRGPAWSPDGQTLAFTSERGGFYEVHLIGRDYEDRQLTHAGADHSELEWHPDGTSILAVRGRRNRFDLVTIDAGSGDATVLAEGGKWGSPHWTASGEVLATYEAHDTPPELRLGGATLHAPAPLAVRRAPHARLEEVTFPSFDGLEIPGLLLRPRDAANAPAVVHPHGGPTDAAGDEWDGHAQYFVDKGYAWLAVNFRGSTGYGREFERRNHGVWGVEDTEDCLAAADYLRGLDWIDGDRLAIFGGSYGSYMALLSVVDDPERRFRCAATKYGDCDILTSWAQGDRLGVQDLERMMRHPSQARAAYRAGSPFHRLENLAVPLLIAHGERDERVHPQQSEQLVAELKRLGGKTFEYVTYPTEGHGFLHAGPQLDFYRRFERFLDWHLL